MTQQSLQETGNHAPQTKEILELLIMGKALMAGMIDTQRAIYFQMRQLENLKNNNTYFTVAADPMREKIFSLREQLLNQSRELSVIDAAVQVYFDREYAATGVRDDAHEHEDTVKSCPNCETSSQSGEVCQVCERNRASEGDAR